MKLITFVCAAFLCLPSLAQEKFPDGTPVSDWFKDSKIVDINTLGKKYILTDYGVINDSTLLQTEKIQSAIDAAAQNGGGVIVIPKGTYLSGALFFKPKTHLHLEEGAVAPFSFSPAVPRGTKKAPEPSTIRGQGQRYGRFNTA